MCRACRMLAQGLLLGQVVASPLSFSISTSGPSFVSLKPPVTPRMDLLRYLSRVRFKVCGVLWVGPVTDPVQ